MTTAETNSATTSQPAAGGSPSDPPRDPSAADSVAEEQPFDDAAERAAIEAAVAGAKGKDTEAPPEKAADKAAEPAKDDKKAEPEKSKDPKEEKIGKALAAVAKREKALVERTAAHQAEVRAWEERARAESSRLEATAQRAQGIIDQARKDPLAFVEATLGITRADLGRRIILDGKASPEELAKGTTTELSEVRREIAALREERKADAQREQVHRAERLFVDTVRSEEGKKSYPTVNRIYADERELIAEGNRVADEVRARAGRQVSFTEILEYLEWRDERRYGAGTRDQAKSADSTRDAAATATKATENGSGHQGKRAEAVSGPGLTNRATAERATMPKDITEMSPDEERRYLLEQVEKARQSA